MNKYEGLFIFDSSAKEEVLKQAIGKVEEAIKGTGGKVLEVQPLEQRAFARVRGQRQGGFYVNIVFDAPSNAVRDLDTKFRLEGGVVRWQFTKREEEKPEHKKKRKKREAAAAAKA